MTKRKSPARNAVIVNDREGMDHLPNPVNPYYVVAHEGLYRHQNTELGRLLIKAKELPDDLPKIGNPVGQFTFTAERLPAALYAQAVHFFRRIYTLHKTEAEVLITRNYRTLEYKLFIPHQRVTGASVKSIYEPTHIARNWMVVGSLHSHCMMGAFHSGTDTGDAADMDGLHGTVGMVMNDPPNLVAMVSMSGENFHYSDPTLVIDTSNLEADTAPEWWDTYVYPYSRQDKIERIWFPSLTDAQFNSFYGTQTTHKPAETNVVSFRAPNVYGPSSYQPKTRINPNNWTDDDKDIEDAIDRYWASMESAYGITGPYRATPPPQFVDRGPAQNLTDAKTDNEHDKLQKHYEALWGPEGELLGTKDENKDLFPDSTVGLSDKLVDAMLGSGCWTDEDWGEETESLADWERIWIGKLTGATEVLNLLGLNVKWSLGKKAPGPLPGQTEAFPAIEAKTGAH